MFKYERRSLGFLIVETKHGNAAVPIEAILFIQDREEGGVIGLTNNMLLEITSTVAELNERLQEAFV